MAKEYSFPKGKIKSLLLEKIHPAAEDTFRACGYTDIDAHAAALGEDELCSALNDVHFLGIRSKTQVTRQVIESAPHLLAIGCFCIGTNQVDLKAASEHGVAVFNAPFSNTRSVAELAIAEVVMLARRAADKSMKLHGGIWEKSATQSFEVRNKVLGIVGYGHIGPQVGLLAEALGMRVVFYDISKKLPLGTAEQVVTLKELLGTADFVTLHVPETDDTKRMISSAQLSQMKKGSYLLNLSRGSVVDVDALKEALSSGHLAGAAVDVFPSEPKSNAETFDSPLRGLENVILTPHVGGSTEEAQHNIGLEVADSIIKYSDTGSTTGSVNFPQIELPMLRESHRVLNIHRNVPGVLGEINGIIAEMGVNISSQYLGTTESIGYLIMDVGKNISREVKKRIDALPSVLRTRLLF